MSIKLFSKFANIQHSSCYGCHYLSSTPTTNTTQ